MQRTLAAKALSLIGILLLVTGTSVSWADQPNVVLFFIDDLGYKDLQCYESSFHATPNVDRLAAEGVRFTNFYSAHPVCSPTRAALMTGKAPQRVGITQWIGQPSEIHLPLKEHTIAEAFASAGYQTGYIGKWHLGERDEHQPASQGFSWSRCVNRAGQPASYFHPFKRRAKNSNKPVKTYWDVPNLDDSVEGDYLTDKLTDEAIKFIEQNRANPFFLCLAHYAVHTPIQSPQVLVNKYRRSRLEKFGDTHPKPLPEQNDSSTRPRQDNPAYAAMIENLDQNVGRVLQKLNELKLDKKTIVVFTSDNGGLSTLTRGRVGPASVRPLRAGKGWTYEGGIRVPTIIRWPGTISAGTNSSLAITMDLYPTLLELAGLELAPQQHLDGMSLVASLRGEPSDNIRNRFLAWHYPHQHGSGHAGSDAIRKGPWKLVRATDKTEAELFNLQEDVGETRNLADDHPRVARDLGLALDQWLKETTLQKRK